MKTSLQIQDVSMPFYMLLCDYRKRALGIMETIAVSKEVIKDVVNQKQIYTNTFFLFQGSTVGLIVEESLKKFNIVITVKRRL